MYALNWTPKPFLGHHAATMLRGRCVKLHTVRAVQTRVCDHISEKESQVLFGQRRPCHSPVWPAAGQARQAGAAAVKDEGLAGGAAGGGRDSVPPPALQRYVWMDGWIDREIY